MSKRSFVIVFGCLSTLLMLSVGTGFWMLTQEKNTVPQESGLVGGAFTLTDHSGNKVTERSYPYKFKLIYFGYTYCPDICPTGMAVITEALEILGHKADAIKPLFITVDPKRDTVQTMSEYYNHFHPSFSNLTGTLNEINKVAKLFKVYSKISRKSDPVNYLMDHSSIMYVMSPEGKYLNHFSSDTTPEQIVTFFNRTLK
jgi:cytochrome oxidase Cu insertion factor (SCO1/SenC/PrrC family)